MRDECESMNDNPHYF